MLQFKFDQPGKGVHPDTPRKTGVAWFLDVLYREFWPMIGLNLLFVLYCIPIFTIGASYSAMCSILIRMLRDKPVDVISDFRLAFKENFKGGTKVFLIQMVILTIFLANYQFYGVMNPYIQGAIKVFGVLLILANLYFVPVLVSVELPLRHVFKNSFFLVFLNLKFTVVAGLIWVVTHCVNVYYIPYSFFPNILMGNVLLAYIVCALCYIGIEKYCYGGNEPEEEIPVETPLSGAEELALLDEEIAALKKQAEEE